jgi:hypothetical protein
MTITAKKLLEESEVSVKFKNGSWFAYCPKYKGLGYSAISEELAREDLLKDMEVFVETHTANGSLDGIIKNLGAK